MATKSLAVLGKDGAGKKTLVGNLLYTSGIDLTQLQQLERNTDRKYSDIGPFFEVKGIAKSFYAPSGKIVVENSATPDIAFWVVDASSSDRGAASRVELGSLVSRGSLKPKGKLLILVNKMDQVNWSEEVFKETASSFEGIELESAEAYIIPVSALRGGNLLETPSEVPWIKCASSYNRKGPQVTPDRTLMQAIG